MMEELYVNYIKQHKKTFDQVPRMLKAKVAECLIACGLSNYISQSYLADTDKEDA